MPPALSPQRAEILGLDALTWLVGDEAGGSRFLAASGISGAELREAAGSPGLTVAVLDFLLAHEDLLLSFCESHDTKPAALHQARHVLGGEA